MDTMAALKYYDTGSNTWKFLLQGPEGATGPTGPTGTDGTDGTKGALWYQGAGSPSTTHNDGDFYLDTSNGDVYEQLSGIWVNVGNIKGPAGGVDLTSDQTVGGVKTFTSVLEENAMGATLASLPVGRSGSSAVTGFQVGSAYPSDDIVGGTDGTGRLNLYSYQRANHNSFGENIRHYLMRKDAKSMDAWYGPVDLYDGSRNPITTDGWNPWAWSGAHYESNAHNGIHGHWEVEVPDTNNQLQGRFTILFADPSNSWEPGVSVTTIGTNLAHFQFQSVGFPDDIGGTTQQYFRLMGSAGFDRAIEFYSTGATTFGSDVDPYLRWKLTAGTNAESGSNAGSDFYLNRYDDTGTVIDTPFKVVRQTGVIQLAGTNSSVQIQSSTTGLNINPQASLGGRAIHIHGLESTAINVQSDVVSDTTNRFTNYVDGKMEWGSGSATRDTNLYRNGVGILKTDTAFVAASVNANNTTFNNHAVTVSSNAGSCSVSFKINTFTNSSAATMAITIPTSGAVDGQSMIVRIYDFSAVAQTIGWTNTEDSLVPAPLTSNGSTTLPLTVGFVYNGATSKWRCIAVS